MRLLFGYSSLGAPTGQTPAQAPQEMQVEESITYLSSPAEIAPTGQLSAQAPHMMHSLLIWYAIMITSKILSVLFYHIKSDLYIVLEKFSLGFEFFEFGFLFFRKFRLVVSALFAEFYLFERIFLV